MERRFGETRFCFSANMAVYVAVMQIWQIVRDGALRW